jgi:hypothetical protein
MAQQTEDFELGEEAFQRQRVWWRKTGLGARRWIDCPAHGQAFGTQLLR